MSQSESAALAAALGKGSKTISVKGIDLMVQPLTLDQISEILLVIDRLNEKGIQVLPESGAKKFSVTQLLMRGGQDFRQILAIATVKEPEFIGSLDILEVTQVAGLIWEVNKNFFVQHQAEMLSAFGLDEKGIALATSLVASMKSLLTSSAEESPESGDSPSIKSSESAGSSTAASVQS